MKMQKRTGLFRALLCSSAMAGISSQAYSQDGVANSNGLPVPGPGGQDGVAGVGFSRGVSPVMPDYSLPQYMPVANEMPAYVPPGPIWQDELGPRLRLETRMGEWLGGDDQGDVAANVLLPFASDGSNAVWVVGARGVTTYDGGASASAGGGLRYYDSFRNRVYGLTGWFDYDDANERTYNQVGLSFESLGKWFDLRISGNYVVDANTNILTSTPTGTVTPVAGGFLVDFQERVESAYNGVQAEIGGPMPILGRYGFESYVGGYYYETDDDEAASGVSVRLQANVTDDVRLGINVTNDDVFATQVFGTVAITLPDGRPTTWFRPRSVRSKLLDRVERRYRTFTNRRIRTRSLPSTGMVAPGSSGGATSGLAVSNIIFVDPNAGTNGVGTFDDPANTFEGFATPADNTLVLVRSGEITGELTMSDGTVVFSEAYTNVSPVMILTQAGAVPLQVFDPNATVPVWSNPTGDPLITIAGDNTEVAGFIFDGTTNAGPYNTIITGTNIQGVNIHNNVFRNYGSAAVNLRNVTGTLADGNPTQVYSNRFEGSTGFSTDGLRIINEGVGELDLELGRTQFNVLASRGLALGNLAYGNSGEDFNGNGSLDAGEDVLDVNGSLDRGAGFRITALNRAIINANIVGNRAENEVDFDGDGQLDSEDINNNGMLDTGEDINLNGRLDFGEDANENGKFDLGNGQGFVITAGATQSTINLTMVDNLADSNIDDGVVLSANSSVLNAGTIGEDVNGDGILTGYEDLNRNGRLDLTEDINGNGVLDFGEDLNGDGTLDTFEDANSNGVLDLTEDLNNNGMLDAGEDLNGDGNLDVFEDANRNGVLDTGEDIDQDGVLDLVEDLDSDGRLDVVEDFDGDGVLDFGEDANEDLDGDGQLDVGEDLNGDGFLNLGNGNGLLDGGQIIQGNIITRNGRSGSQRIGRDGFRVDSTNNAAVSLRFVGNSFGVQDDRSTGNGGAGLNLNADSGSMVANIGFLYHEDVNFDGILDPGEDTNGNGSLDTPALVHANQFVANTNGGLIFDLSGTATGEINAINNFLTGTGGGVLGFSAVGDTTLMPFNFVNSSAIGINISEIRWNVAAAGLEFNTDNMNGGQPFNPVNGTDGLTGLTDVNGTTGPFTVANLATNLNLVFSDFDPINGVLDPSEDVNGNLILDAGEDLNNNGMLDLGEDLNMNGFLDGSEDVNMNGVLDPGEDLNMNGLLDTGEDVPELFTFDLDLDPAGMSNMAVIGNQLIGSIVDVTFSTGQQLRGTMQADPNDPTAAIFVAQVSNLGSGNGIQITASDNAVVNQSLIFNNTISNFGGAGLAAEALGEGNIQGLTVRSNMITGNGSNDGNSGFRSGIELFTGSSIDARLTADLFNNVITDNIGGAIDAFADGGTLNLTRIESSMIDDNGFGVSLSAAQAATLTARVTNNQISNSVNTNGTTGDGLDVLADGATIIISEIADNIVSNNANDGLRLAAENGGTLTVTQSEDINQNGVLDVGEDVNEDTNMNGILDAGEDANQDGILNLGNGNGLLDRGIFSNNFVNNAGNTFVIDATNGTIDIGNINQNLVVYNTAGTGGFSITGINSQINASFTGNTVTGDPANNPTAGPGFHSETSGGDFNIRVGGPQVDDGNIFSLNRGAGIAFTMEDSGTGSFLIQNNVISSVVDDADPLTPFQGDGIAVNIISSDALPAATATLQRSEIIGNVIGDFTNATLGTAGSGIAVLLAENSSIEDLLIADNAIGNAGNDNPTLAIIPANFIDDAGIRFDRLDDSELNLVNPRPGQLRAVTIENNVVMNNGTMGSSVDGLQINVMNGIRDDIDFSALDNVFSTNTGEGIHMNTQADASLAIDLTRNLIEDNVFNGILLEGDEIIATDLETQGGTWIQNIIRNNGTNGIEIDGVSGDVVDLIIGLNGIDPVTGMSLGNLIEGNGQDGIEINSGGFVQINNNVIARNGLAGLDINANFVGLRNALIQNNSITENGGDGFELFANGSVSVTVAAFGNSIDNNAGRGVDLLNRAAGVFSPIMNVRFGDGTAEGMNRISSNGEEGFYVVNTSATGQNQTNNSRTALATGGNIFADPDMVLDIDRNIISANNNTQSGIAGIPFPGGGFVLRVGSSNTLQGAFVGTSIADTTGDVFGSGSGFGSTIGVGANSAVFGNGRVNARIVNNTFEGNLGDDVYFESFTSTIDPNASAGVWDAMNFTPMGANQTDPLARLNLVFRGNVGNSLNVTNVGAFYNNAEGVFKSRLGTAVPGGPFVSATRRRNAQRVQARGVGVGQLPPFGLPDNGIYQYAGMGASTFRIESDFDVSGFQAGDTFFLDGTPVPPIFNANGISRVGPDEMPYGWGTAAPGTFQFDDAFLGLLP